MADFGRFFALAFAGVGLMTALAVIPLSRSHGPETWMAVIMGSLVGLTTIVIAYFFNRRAFLVKEKSMMKVFFVGMFLRFAVVAVCFLIVIAWTDFNLVAFAVTVISCYMILQIYEVGYLKSKLANKKRE